MKKKKEKKEREVSGGRTNILIPNLINADRSLVLYFGKFSIGYYANNKVRNFSLLFERRRKTR